MTPTQAIKFALAHKTTTSSLFVFAVGNVTSLEVFECHQERDIRYHCWI